MTALPRGSALLGSLLFVACGANREPPAQGGKGPTDVALEAPASSVPPAIPMAGDPDDEALASARLVRLSCEEQDADRERQLQARIEDMRQRVDESYTLWEQTAGELCDTFHYGHRRGVRPSMPRVLGRSGMAVSGGGMGAGAGSGVPRPAPSANKSAESRRERQVSKTNTQVAGVDEADIVKTDGDYLYLATGDSVRIVNTETLKQESVLKLKGQVRELFLDGDRLVVYAASHSAQRVCTYGYDCEVAGDGSRTTVSVLELGDRKGPKVVRSFELSGSLIAARKIGQAVHTVVSDLDAPEPPILTTPDDAPWCGVRAAKRKALRASFEKLKADNEQRLRGTLRAGYPTLTESGTSRKLCEVLETPAADGKAMTTLVSFDLGQTTPPSTVTVRSRPGTVFASEDALYVAVRHVSRDSYGHRGRFSGYGFFSAEDEVSDLHKFRIGASAARTEYRGSGVIPGHVLNQFAMDERDGVLRVATSKGKVPDPNVHSVLSMLVESKRGNLIRVGAVSGIAPGEDIRAVRFDDDRGYIVTFKKTDPLFVLDLADPLAPKVLGELKIPGFSTYMQRIDREHLLSIGFDSDDHGDFAYFNGLLLQIFDVKDPMKPKLLHRQTIGTRGSSSEAATNHLAFTYMKERNLLAIPATVCEGGGDGRFGTLEFSGLVLIETSVEGGFRKLGGVNHGTKGVSCSSWWSQANSQVKRSVLVDDRVFSIAGDHLKAQSLKKLGHDLLHLSFRN